MKISGWEKLSGITYKGYSIINPMVNPESTQYFADILDISTNYKIDLQLDTKAGFGDSYVLKLSDIKNKVYVQRMIQFDMLKSISNFRMIFEFCIEDYIKEVEATWTNQYRTSNVAQAQTAQLPKSSSFSMPTFDEFARLWNKPNHQQLTQTLISK